MEKREDEIYGEGNEEDPKNEEIQVLLALLDYFETLVDRCQDHMEDMAMLLDCNRRCIRNMDHCVVDGLLKNIVKFKFVEFSFASYVESDGSFEEKLQERVQFQKQATKEGRERQKLSFAELYGGFPAFVKTLGSKLSGFLVVYFLRISDGDRREIERKRKAVKNILKMEINLEGKSKIINTLVSVVDFLDNEMAKRAGSKKGAQTKTGFDLSEQNHLLGMILFEVLNLEVAFSRPVFHGHETQDSLLGVGNLLANLFMTNLNAIRSYIKKIEANYASSASTKDSDQKREKLKAKLSAGVHKIWDNIPTK